MRLEFQKKQAIFKEGSKRLAISNEEIDQMGRSRELTESSEAVHLIHPYIS